MANFAIMAKISYVTNGRAPNPLDFVRTKSMATQPQIPLPDTIEPQSPPEMPPSELPAEEPVPNFPEIVPENPDQDRPDRALPEVPAVE